MRKLKTNEIGKKEQTCEIAVLTVIRNEEGIIERFIRHAFSFCDRIYICDHSSTDRTVDVIKALMDEGLDIRLTHSTASGYPQEQITHGLLRQAIAEGAGWLVPLDADEFPACETGTVRATILSLNPLVEWRYLWRNFFFSSKDKLKARNFFDRFDIYVNSHAGKCLFHSSLYAHVYCRITSGNHFLKYAGRRNIPPVKLIPGVILAHFPAPTLGKLVWKNINFSIVGHSLNRRYDEIVNHGWIDYEAQNISDLYATGGEFSPGTPPVAEIVTRYSNEDRFESDERFVIAQLATACRKYHDQALRVGLNRFQTLDKYRQLLRYGFVATIGTLWNVVTRAQRKHKSRHGQQLTSGMGGFYIHFTDI